MKKKGLLISTIVMVVVLIAALTTSTYAWFEASSVAKVSDISMKVGATSNVQIGMRLSTAEGKSVANYKNGDITFTSSGEFSSGTQNALGTAINTNLALDVTGGVGSGTNNGGVYKMDESYSDSSKYLLKANGSDFASLGTPELARINGNGSSESIKSTDVIDFHMGIRAAKDGIYGTYGKIVVTISESQYYVGMIAALRAEIKVGDKAYAGDVFGENVGYDTIMSGASDGKVTYVFYFMIDALSNSRLDKAGDVTPFSIRMFISGYDDDCNKDATGTEATISLEFDGCDSNSWNADTNWTVLELK